MSYPPLLYRWFTYSRPISFSHARRSPQNVLPLVNKGLALYQWKQDAAAAERCCNEALRIDPECEAAVATLAQLNLQQGKIDQAVKMFERHTELARSEPELINALTYQHVGTFPSSWPGWWLTVPDLTQASYAQMEFIQRYPELASQLSALARTMG